MTLIIEVSAEEETRLLVAAAQRRQNSSDYLLTLARQEFSASPIAVPPSKYEGMSLAEALAGHIG